MKNRNILFACAIVLSAVFLVSCQKGLELRVFNNTGSSIVVEAGWSHGKTKTLVLLQGENCLLDWPLSLKVQSTSNTWRYPDFPRIHSNFLESQISSYLLRVQVQSDGKIYALLKGTAVVTTNYAAQPPEFPVEAEE